MKTSFVICSSILIVVPWRCFQSPLFYGLRIFLWEVIPLRRNRVLRGVPSDSHLSPLNLRVRISDIWQVKSTYWFQINSGERRFINCISKVTDDLKVFRVIYLISKRFDMNIPIKRSKDKNPSSFVIIWSQISSFNTQFIIITWFTSQISEIRNRRRNYWAKFRTRRLRVLKWESEGTPLGLDSSSRFSLEDLGVYSIINNIKRSYEFT